MENIIAIGSVWGDFSLNPSKNYNKFRMWHEHKIEFYIHPIHKTSKHKSFLEFFQRSRDGVPRGIIKVIKLAKMIKSTKQKNRTLKDIEKFEKELAKLKKQDIKPIIKDAYINSYKNMINELKTEVEEYDQLSKGNFELPKNISFIELLKNLTKLRIAKGLSQSELAARLGIDRQQINRYEEHDYQTASLDRIIEIMNVFEIHELINLKPIDKSNSLTPFELNNLSNNIFKEIQESFCQSLKEYKEIQILKAYVEIDLLEKIVSFSFLINADKLNTTVIKEFYEFLTPKVRHIFDIHKFSNIQIGIDTIIPIITSDINPPKRNNENKELYAIAV